MVDASYLEKVPKEQSEIAWQAIQEQTAFLFQEALATEAQRA